MLILTFKETEEKEGMLSFNFERNRRKRGNVDYMNKCTFSVMRIAMLVAFNIVQCKLKSLLYRFDSLSQRSQL